MVIESQDTLSAHMAERRRHTCNRTIQPARMSQQCHTVEDGTMATCRPWLSAL